MPAHQRWLFVVAGAAALTLSPMTVSGQRLDPRLLQQVPTSEILERLRATGMTRQQARATLQRMGYDPSLADPYFDMLERDSGARPRSGLMDALGEAGLARPGRGGVDSVTGRGLDAGQRVDPLEELLEDLLGLTPADVLAAGELPVFGASFFRRSRVADEPAFGPVEPGYRLGPGDQVNVILTGAVQDVYPLVISREGRLIVPDLGEVPANGLTVQALENVLRSRLSEVYASGLTQVSVSLGRIRAIEVYVVGDVVRPGPYQVSGLGTVMSALYRAGGPSSVGSFRAIEVRRGNRVVHRLDLYGYLLSGNSSVDVRLQHGDVLFVPPVSRRVIVDGAVRRPAQYELLSSEGLDDALRFAGGFGADAALDRVQIDRILPPEDRQPGVERIILDVNAVRVLAGADPAVPLLDGDRILLPSVAAERRNSVVLIGEVRRPGAYGWSPGTSLGDVLERASGLTESAHTERAHIFRLDPATGMRRMVPASATPDEARRIILEDRDSVVIYDRTQLRDQEYVTIGGLVRQPGRYQLYDGATVNDVILSAGGFADGAYEVEAYVARPGLAAPHGDAIARTFRIAIPRTDPDAHDSSDDQREFVLRHGDRIEIRRVPGYQPPRVVVMDGEVALPGAYLLETRGDRVSTVLRAAGGLTDEANPAGVHVIRGGRTLAVDVTRARADMNSPYDIALEDGDTVRAPRFDPMILVVGAVVHDSTRVLYRPGMSVADVVREAGGFARDADRNRLTVTRQNGVRNGVRRLPLLPDRQPQPEPGSTVYVPSRIPGLSDGLSWPTVVAQLVGVVSAAATLIIALNSGN